MFYAKVIIYDVWGNEKDGYDVNNIFDVAKVRLNGDPNKLTSRQIIRRLHGRPMYKQWNGSQPVLDMDLRKMAIDNNSMDLGSIELTNRSGSMPIGRIELFDEKEERIY